MWRGGDQEPGPGPGNRPGNNQAHSNLRPPSLSVSQHPQQNPTPFSAFPTAWAITSTGEFMRSNSISLHPNGTMIQHPSELLPHGLLATPQPSTPSASLLKVLGPRTLAVAGPDGGHGPSGNSGPADSPATSAGGISPQMDSLVLPSPSLLPGGVHSLPTPSPSSQQHRPHDAYGGRGSPYDKAAGGKDGPTGSNKDTSNAGKGLGGTQGGPGNGKRPQDSRGGNGAGLSGPDGRRTDGPHLGGYPVAGGYPGPHPYASPPGAPGSPPLAYAGYYMAHVPPGALMMGMRHASSTGSGEPTSKEGSAHGANNSGAAPGREGGGPGGANWRGGGRSAGGAAAGASGGGKNAGQYGSEGGPLYGGMTHMQHGPYAVYGMMPPGMVMPQMMPPVVGSPRDMEGHHMGPMLVTHGPSMPMGPMPMGPMGSAMHPYPPHGPMAPAGHHMGMGMGMHPVAPHHPGHPNHPHGYPPPPPHGMPGGGYGGGSAGGYGPPYGVPHGGPYGPGRGTGGGGKGVSGQQQGPAGQKGALQTGKSGGSGGLSAGGGSGDVGGGNGSGRDSPRGGKARAKGEKARAQELRERKPANSRAPALIAQCAAPAAALEPQLQSLAERLTPGQDELDAHAAALEAVRSLVAGRWPEVKVHLFGSAANGLSIAGANAIDVTLEVPGMAWDDHAAKAAMVAALGDLAAGGPVTAATAISEAAAEAAEAGAADGVAAAGTDGPASAEARAEPKPEGDGDVADSAASVAPAADPPAVSGAGKSEGGDAAAAAEAVGAAAAAAEGAGGEGAAEDGRSAAAPMQSVTAMPKARTPIVKLTVPETHTRVDITINNLLALHNTRLLGDYGRLDPRLRTLARLVKHWARTRCVNDAYRGSLSSYAYALLCIWLMQQRKPPILPVLQQRKPHTYDAAVGPWRCSYNDQLDELDGFGAANTESLTELLVAFFDHWAWRHDYNGAVVCVRTGGTTTKAAKEWIKRQGNERHLMCIEDPFELSHDLGRTIDKAAVQVLRREFERAARIFATNPDPLPELLAPLTPEEAAAAAAAQQSRRRAAKEKEKAKAAAAAAAVAVAGGDGAEGGAAGGDSEEGAGGGPSASGDREQESEEGDWSGEAALQGDVSLSGEAQEQEPAAAQEAAATVAEPVAA